MICCFLPDGRHFLFWVTGNPEAAGIYVGQLDGTDSKRLSDAAGMAVYTAGRLLYTRDGRILAQDFDTDRLELVGDPEVIADQMSGGTALSASASGTIAYRMASPDSGQRQIVWVDRAGHETDKVIYSDTAALGGSLSHDGRRVAVYRFQNGNMDIWSFDANRRAWERLTFQPGDDIYPIWSRDGTSMVTGAVRTTTIVDLYRTSLTGAQASEELLFTSELPKFPMDWSADGRFLLYDTLDRQRGFDIWALPLEGTRTPVPLVQTDFNEGLAQFSPDGRWVAYQSDRTGRVEVYLRPFPGPGADVRVSVDGGSQVRWSPDATELFYVAADNRLMAVPIRILSDGKAIEPGTPTALFTTILSGAAGPTYKQQYMVSPDGKSFVMQSAVGQPTASPVTVIVNWKPKTRR